VPLMRLVQDMCSATAATAVLVQTSEDNNSTATALGTTHVMCWPTYIVGASRTGLCAGWNPVQVDRLTFASASVVLVSSLIIKRILWTAKCLRVCA
jgi:hypothetical protein